MKKASSKKPKTIVKKTKKGDTVIIKKKSKYVPVPPKEHQFKKGQSGNPHGVSKEKVAIKAFTATQLINAINMVTSLSAEEAEQLVKDRSLPLTELVVLRAIIDAAHDGNYSKFYEVVEFILGKVPNKIEVISSLKDKIEDKEKLKQALKAVEDEV
jgi:hypothetical protein